MTIADTGLAVTLERDFAIAPELMWELWTTPEHVAAWLRPSLDRYRPSTCTAQVAEGGSYRLVIPAVDAGAPDWVAYGRYLELDPPRRLRFTWGWEGDVPDTSEVEVTLAPSDKGCLLTLTHTRLWDQGQLEQHTAGWTGTLDVLAHLYE